MAVVGEVPGLFGGVVFATEHVLALLDGLFGVLEGHEAGASGGVEHGLLEGALHGAQRVDGEGHDEVVLVAVLALRPAGVVMGTEVAKAPSVVEGHHVWHGRGGGSILEVYRAGRQRQTGRPSSRLASGSRGGTTWTRTQAPDDARCGQMQRVHKQAGRHRMGRGVYGSTIPARLQRAEGRGG